MWVNWNLIKEQICTLLLNDKLENLENSLKKPFINENLSTAIAMPAYSKIPPMPNYKDKGAPCQIIPKW